MCLFISFLYKQLVQIIKYIVFFSSSRKAAIAFDALLLLEHTAANDAEGETKDCHGNRWKELDDHDVHDHDEDVL